MQMTKEQIVCVAKLIFDSAMNVVLGTRAGIQANEANKDLQDGAKLVVAHALPALFTKITGQEMGTIEFYGWNKFEALIDNLANSNDLSNLPDFQPLAEEFVKKEFWDFFEGGPLYQPNHDEITRAAINSVVGVEPDDLTEGETMVYEALLSNKCVFLDENGVIKEVK